MNQSNTLFFKLITVIIKYMNIATKSGDDGYTDIIGEQHLPKNHPLIECLGTIDELNAFLGDAKAALGVSSEEEGNRCLREIISEIQKNLIKLMGVIAGMPVPFGGMDESRLDSLIKELESKMPPFASFAIPGVNPVSAKLHIARTVCRRVERCMVGLGLASETKSVVIPYINRLSDLLFLLAQKEAADRHN